MAKEVNYSSMTDISSNNLPEGFQSQSFFAILQAIDLKRLMEYVTEQKQTSYPILRHGRSDDNKINDGDEKATIWNSFRSCFNVSHPSLEVQGALNL